MRARSARVVLLACLPLMVLSAGAGVTLGWQGGDEVIQCHSSSEEGVMNLEFPAGGGAVEGSYASDYTAHDTSLLYDEDGSSQYYAEQRTVRIDIQFSGSYSGSDGGVFSFQIVGSGRVDIDNLEGDRFDRSYRAELEGGATGSRNEDGSITIRSVTAEFTPVARNASEIPNTRWLEPPSTPVLPELTLTCTGWPEVPSEIAGPGGIAQQPGAPQPNGPPQPPGLLPPVAPQSRPGIPPAPPPVPAPMGECGSVQVVYLDDLGIDPNPAEIDAFIENALAQGGQDYSLIVSHRQRLLDRFGPPAFQQIDTLLGELGSIAQTCPFVLVVGDPDVVPFAALPNPTSDGDVLFTDDVYGDNDHDNLTMPDIPVARIPDGRSLDLLLTQLSPSHVPEGGNFTLANSKRPHADGVATQVFGTDRILFWSLPARREHVDPSLVDVRHGYFMLHGGSWDTSVWWGEEDVYPEAFTVAEAESQGVILSGSCYGTYTYNRTPVDSITLAFLHSGARAFVGATGITYSPLWTPGPDPTGPMRYDAVFHHAFLDALSRGEPALAAFMQAKEQMADLCESGDATAPEIKMLHEFVYFGKP
ncbi:MAG: hypothetical protein CEE40_03025 [Chloroflexi bacterium B3_Chlor]|nr:MAG: hypothetical protein CEE40_03025 [Chloroflexi bacterium B3_Chlor]